MFQPKALKTFLRIWVIAFLLTECSRETIFLPNLTGSLVGYVYTFDEFAQLLDDHSGVIVTAIGKQRSYQSRTDAAGRFELKGLPVGTYELHFEKTGFGTMKQFEIQHLGGKPTILGIENLHYGDECFAIFLYELPTTEILGLSIENDSLTGTFEFTGPEPERIGLITYYSTEPGFSPEQAVSAYSLTLTHANEKYQKRLSDIYFSKFQPGEPVYFKAIILSKAASFRTVDNILIRFVDTYIDPETHTNIIPNLGNGSQEFSFVMPE